ncbi:helix-turn-helix domain-containing protein [Paenibacillus harenae]|uniref:helix-turn-helix domain-containing protein n=1 Tax=Paenibacillus harenae TaxID=306543 RepID=UPI001FDEB55B|nr:helix-turn-helix transcriptional regulator [Paenibacillus harenae]
MNTVKKIGESIRLLRLKKGLSQEQLALHSGVNTSYLGQVERGENNPTIHTLEKIATGLEVPIGSLIGDSELTDCVEKNKKTILAVLNPDDLKQLVMGAIKTNAMNLRSESHSTTARIDEEDENNETN